jgi:hypothetical protein
LDRPVIGRHHEAVTGTLGDSLAAHVSQDWLHAKDVDAPMPGQ